MMEQRSRRKSAILQSDTLRRLMQGFNVLSPEKKGVVLSHIGILVFSFFPWMHITSNVSEYAIILFSRGNVSLFLILTIIFLSALVLFLFIDSFLGLKTIKLPFSTDYVYAFVGMQQFIIAFLALSALVIWGKQIGIVRLSFGFFFTMICIIAAIVATFLDIRVQKRKKTQEFFRSPASSPAPDTTQASSEPKQTRINQVDKI